jgi:hypothetical protein
MHVLVDVGGVLIQTNIVFTAGSNNIFAAVGSRSVAALRALGFEIACCPVPVLISIAS